MKLHYTAPLRGELLIPGDKSISHRAVMLASLAEGTTKISHFLYGADCLSTIDCFRRMGIEIEEAGNELLVHGKGLYGLSAPSERLFVGNSGTTLRLISGILAGQPFETVLSGDESIRKRPMERILDPLRKMGAGVSSDKGCAPLTIRGGKLNGIEYETEVASAQVKSCILLAGLFAEGPTSVTEPALSRNHTELMLRRFGAKISTFDTTAEIMPDPVLHAQEIEVPGDISSAAYFIAAALLVPGSEVLLKNVGINPTRTGFLDVCRMMGADIELLNEKNCGGEASADLLVKSSSLNAATIGGDLIPRLIDELPVIAVMAAFAKGTTVIKDAGELRVKESDRIALVTENLRRMGAKAEAREDGMVIFGGRPLKGAEITTEKDHRVAMSFAVAALACDGETTLLDADCVNISYPDFYRDLNSLYR